MAQKSRLYTFPNGQPSDGQKVQLEFDNVYAGINNIDATQIQDGSMTTAKLANGAVTSLKLENLSITTAKLVDGAVTTPKLADSSVTSPKIADNAITTIHIADGSITNAKMQSDIINTDNILAGAVTSPKIANNSVTNEKLTGNIEQSKILDTGYLTTRIDKKIESEIITSGNLPNTGNTHVLKTTQGATIFPVTIASAISDLTGANLGDGSITVEKLSPAVVDLINNSVGFATTVIDCGNFEDSSIILEFDCGTF
jgi:hypothetical protein